MKQNRQRVSVVIPAYNEEDRIALCLKSLMMQTQKPYEIILVSNNCTDQTELIAARFEGVKIIKESNVGRAFAQKTGFNCAKGDILARLDADSIVPPDWVKDVTDIFTSNPDFDAISGYGKTYTGVKCSIISRIWSWTFYVYCRGYFGSNMMWGSNMAMTKKIWEKARPLLNMRKEIHEDQDLSLALASVNAKIQIVPKLLVEVDFAGIQYFGKFLMYNQLMRHVKSLDKINYKRSLLPRKKFPVYRRIFDYMISAPFVLIFYPITLAFSMFSFIREFSNYFKVLLKEQD